MTIYFDMDGTISNLYGVKDWLFKLRSFDPSPYAEAIPMVNFSVLARYLNKLQKQGYKIGIVSWLSKNSNANYDSLVTEAKKHWLKKHLPSVHWDEINIVSYGLPKSSAVQAPHGILFDDEENNRKNWLGTAYDEKNLLENLKKLLTA